MVIHPLKGTSEFSGKKEKNKKSKKEKILPASPPFLTEVIVRSKKAGHFQDS